MAGSGPIASLPEHGFNCLRALPLRNQMRCRLEQEACLGSGHALLSALPEFRVESPDACDYTTVAERLEMKASTLAVHVHRLRQRLRDLVRVERAKTVAAAALLAAEFHVLRSLVYVDGER